MTVSITLTEKLKIARVVVSGGFFSTFRRMSFNRFWFWRLSGPTADELLIAPQDIQTPDPTRADDYYAGYFAFAGKTANCSGQSPFEIYPPTEAWYRELTEFGWLRHLRAADTEIARVQARVHVDDWVRFNPKPSSSSWNVESTAKRVIAWLCHTPLLLEGCEHPFYRRFMKSLTKQVRYLRLLANDAPAGMPRLHVAIALSYASVCIAGHESFVKNASKRLSRELEAQILADGGHISRNPQAIIDILGLLLPLRQAILSRNFVPEEAMIQAIDRMMPMLRFFRLGDGNFGHFNGVGDTPADLIATILAYDDTVGTPVLNAPHSGYQRFDIADTVILMDTGALPPESVVNQMHAGCLSFEMSSGRDRLIVNCGQPATHTFSSDGPLWEKLARTTATHSTLSINNESSCRFVKSEKLDRILTGPILSGPQNVPVERSSDNGAVTVTATHDGYGSRFSMKHTRQIALSADGTVLTGQDLITTTRDKQIQITNQDSFQLRFHLHPNVSAVLSSPRTVELETASGKRWLFSCSNANVELDETIVLADVFGSKQSRQIVIDGILGELSEINWIFQRLS